MDVITQASWSEFLVDLAYHLIFDGRVACGYNNGLLEQGTLPLAFGDYLQAGALYQEMTSLLNKSKARLTLQYMH